MCFHVFHIEHCGRGLGGHHHYYWHWRRGAFTGVCVCVCVCVCVYVCVCGWVGGCACVGVLYVCTLVFLCERHSCSSPTSLFLSQLMAVATYPSLVYVRSSASGLSALVEQIARITCLEVDSITPNPACPGQGQSMHREQHFCYISAVYCCCGIRVFVVVDFATSFLTEWPSH